jgi:hypothetical protein
MEEAESSLKFATHQKTRRRIQEDGRIIFKNSVVNQIDDLLHGYTVHQ